MPEQDQEMRSAFFTHMVSIHIYIYILKLCMAGERLISIKTSSFQGGRIGIDIRVLRSRLHKGVKKLKSDYSTRFYQI